MPEWEERWPWHQIKMDQETREMFLRDSQPFIRHVASQACYKTLEWGRDEELSEALIAFNEAIEHYEEERGVPFLAYARLLIKRRLIDYYRHQRGQENLSLDKEEVGQAVDLHISLHGYGLEEQNRERAMEIQEFAKNLSLFGLNFNDLVEVSPKHQDSRKTLLRVARELAWSDLWPKVKEKGKIPMQELALRTGIHPKVLERGRKYILAVALLLANQYEYVYLREYVLPRERGKVK